MREPATAAGGMFHVEVGIGCAVHDIESGRFLKTFHGGFARFFNGRGQIEFC